MQTVRQSAPQLRDLVPYDPKYLPAEAMMSANENPFRINRDIVQKILSELNKVPLNRYPDPLANELRDLIATAYGLDHGQVLLGNGGDELLFDIALAWGGSGRKMIDMPPTFSVYAANARLTNTEVVNIPRLDDFSIDEQAVLDRVAEGDIDYVIVTSPNNPTGELANERFILQLLEATDALVLVDEAYFEFSRRTVRQYLGLHKNLIILRTFSKAFSLAGVRMGYVMAHEDVINELIKVRQPYSVDAISQAVAKVVFCNREKFEPSINLLISERDRMLEELAHIPRVVTYPSDSNFILLRLLDEQGSADSDAAAEAWQVLYDAGILVRDFSRSAMLEGCLRVSMGEPKHNDIFIRELKKFIKNRK